MRPARRRRIFLAIVGRSMLLLLFLRQGQIESLRKLSQRPKFRSEVEVPIL